MSINFNRKNTSEMPISLKQRHLYSGGGKEREKWCKTS
jgi:hypothetical protein